MKYHRFQVYVGYRYRTLSLLVCAALYAMPLLAEPEIPNESPRPSTGSAQILNAYYTWYQDPNCQDGQGQTFNFTCPSVGNPCPTTLLEDSEVTNSAAEFVDLFFGAPNQVHGLQLEVLVNGMQNQAQGMCKAGYCPPPRALVQGISAVHAAGKKVIFSLGPGTGQDTWGPPFDMDEFKKVCQQVLTSWDLDGFAMDCEPCAPNIDEIFDAWAGLTPNEGRGLPTSDGGRRPYVFLTAETYTLPSIKKDTTLDFLQLMDSNYTIGAGQMLGNLQAVRQAWAKSKPKVPILLGVKPGVTSLETLSQALKDSKTKPWQEQSPFGWMLFNISRDAGCLTGATGKACNPPTENMIKKYPVLGTCTAYGQYGLTSPPTASYSLLNCLTDFLTSGDVSKCEESD